MTLKRLMFRCISSTILALSALCLAVPVFAATSASVNGYVKDGNGDPIADADIVVVHEPSGTTSTATSGENGSFYQGGLRVGGPYTLRISATGYEDEEVSVKYLNPGNQPAPAIALRSSGMEELTVTAPSPTEGTLQNGIGSAYTADDLLNSPGGDRDAINTLLRDPLAQSEGEGNLSVAGVNSRFNGFAIDGSLQQDDFGLGENTYATERSPINLDAIESVSIVASDYSVTASGFTGGLVNITTKSGANEWDGSLFYYFQNDGHIGSTYDGDRTYRPGSFDELELGFTIGGPIIEDEMFFFLSIDEYETTESVDFTQSDFNNGVQPGFYDAFRGLIQEIYNYDPGTRPGVASTPATSERILMKFDWNVSDLHRLSVTHQITKENSTSVGSTRFESSWIDVPVDLDSTMVQLFSDWNDVASTTFRLSVKNFARGQNCRAGPGVGSIEISNIRASDVAGTVLEDLLTGRVSVSAGCDRFRHANAYNDERVQLFGALDYLYNGHIFQVGMELETFDLFNLFVPGSAGRFRFFSFRNFLERRARVDYVNTVTNNATDGAAAWGYTKTTIFGQDIFEPYPGLEVTVGARMEFYAQDENPAASATLRSTYGVDSQKNLDGLSSFLPRASVRWTGWDDTVVTAGLGLFSGGDPKVWTSNAFQVPTVYASTSNATNVSPLTVPQQLRDRVAAAGTGVPIDIIAGDFEIPSDWKFSLRLDHTFDMQFGETDWGDNYSFIVQYLLVQTNNGFQWRNLAQTELTATQPTGTAPDGRIIYADLDDLDILNLTQLRNFSGGNSQSLTFTLAKQYASGLDAMINYAWQDVNMVTEGLSSRGISNWRGIVDVDRNDPSPRSSPHAVKHSWKLALGYERELPWAGMTIRGDIFGQYNSGRPYSFTFDTNWDNSLFGRAGAGESPYDNSPLYIPTGPNDPKVVFRSSFNQDAFFEYLSNNDIPSGIHDPYTGEPDWVSSLDFRLQLSVPNLGTLSQLVGDNAVTFVLDIDNVLNFINDSWGVYYNGPSYFQAPLVRADLVSAADVAARGVDRARALKKDDPRTTCVQATDCVYRFNSFRELSLSFPNGVRSVYQIRFGLRIDI